MIGTGCHAHVLANRPPVLAPTQQAALPHAAAVQPSAVNSALAQQLFMTNQLPLVAAAQQAALQRAALVQASAVNSALAQQLFMINTQHYHPQQPLQIAGQQPTQLYGPSVWPGSNAAPYQALPPYYAPAQPPYSWGVLPQPQWLNPLWQYYGQHQQRFC